MRGASRPASRSPWAPWIATLPKIAIAPRSPRSRRARAPRGAQLHRGDVRDHAVISRASRETSASVERRARTAAPAAAPPRAAPSRGSPRRGRPSRIARGGGRQASPASAEPRAGVSRGARLADAARGRGERIAREHVAQRDEHRHDRREHAAAGAIATLCQLTTRSRADGERQREEGRVGVQHVDRELLARARARARRRSGRARPRRAAAPRSPSAACSRRDADRRPAGGAAGTVSSMALNANRNPTSALIAANSAVDWLLAAAALANSVLRSRSTRRSGVRRPVAAARARTRACAPGGGLYEDAAHARAAGRSVPVRRRAGRSRPSSCAAHRSGRRAAASTAALARAPGELQVHFLAEAGHADRVRQRRGQHHRADAPEGRAVRCRARACRRAPRGSCRRRSSCTEALPCGPPRSRRLRAAVRRRARRESRARAPASLREAVRVARQQLQRGVTGDPARELRDGALQARVDDLRGEQQRDPGGDPDDRKALLPEARAQAHAIQAQGVRGSRRRSSTAAGS